MPSCDYILPIQNCASSEKQANYGCEKMSDGKDRTLWRSMSDLNKIYDWVHFGLREKYLINKLRIRSYSSNGPKDIDLHFSNTRLHHKLSQGKSGKIGEWEDIEVLPSAIVSRYLNLTVINQYVSTTQGTDTDTYLDEIQILGCRQGN